MIYLIKTLLGKVEFKRNLIFVIAFFLLLIVGLIQLQKEFITKAMVVQTYHGQDISSINKGIENKIQDNNKIEKETNSVEKPDTVRWTPTEIINLMSTVFQFILGIISACISFYAIKMKKEDKG